MYFKKNSGYLLIEIIIALSIIIMILLVTVSKSSINIYALRDTADEISTMIRDSHQYYRSTLDITTKIKIVYKSNSCNLVSVRKGEPVETLTIPNSCVLTWAKYNEDNIKSNESDFETSIGFRRETVFCNSISGAGLTLYLTDKKSNKFIKITIVPTSGRVYVYDET
ncbi:MAG: hypothetical protein ACRDA4_06355 [Filifactoraceae bacterium]